MLVIKMLFINVFTYILNAGIKTCATRNRWENTWCDYKLFSYDNEKFLVSLNLDAGSNIMQFTLSFPKVHCIFGHIGSTTY